MKYSAIIISNLFRKKATTLFTLLSVAAAFLLFGLLSAAEKAVTGGVDLAGVDRLFTMHKVSIIQPLPLSYFNIINGVNGVVNVTHASVFDAYYKEPLNYVPALVVDSKSYLEIYDEMVLSETQKNNFLNNPEGVIIGVTLAARFDWKVGDRVPLVSTVWRTKDGGNTWYFKVEGIYDTSQQGGDTSTLFINYNYFNEGRVISKDTVLWYMTKVANPQHAASVAKEIDNKFSNSPAETKTSTEKALVQSLVAQFGNIGTIVVGVSSAVFFSMLLVIWNAMAQSISERANEISVLRVIGYSKAKILMILVLESLAIVGIGGVIGLLMAALISKGIAVSLVQYLPDYSLSTNAIFTGFGLIAIFGIFTGLLPGIMGVRLTLADTLRK